MFDGHISKEQLARESILSRRGIGDPNMIQSFNGKTILLQFCVISYMIELIAFASINCLTEK